MDGIALGVNIFVGRSVAKDGLSEVILAESLNGASVELNVLSTVGLLEYLCKRIEGLCVVDEGLKEFGIRICWIDIRDGLVDGLAVGSVVEIAGAFVGSMTPTPVISNCAEQVFPPKQPWRSV